MTSGIALGKSLYRFHCKMCSLSFHNQRDLKTHFFSVHETIKGSSCPYCHKWFKSSLRQHIVEVHRQNQYSCDTCDKLFDTKRSLTRHQKLAHKDGGKVEESSSSVSCQVCGVHVLSRKLTSHIEVHHLLPEKFSVPCPLCPTRARFLPYHLNAAHPQVNIRKELYPCRKCCRYFLSCDDLNRHEKNHQEYPCSLCEQSYEKFLDLGWHFLNHHNLVYNPVYRASRAKKNEYLQEIDVTKLQLYSFDSSQEDEKANLYEEIEVDVDDSESGQVDKVLVYISKYSDQQKVRAPDNEDKANSYHNNHIAVDYHDTDHEDLDDPEPLNQVISDVPDLINEENDDSVSKVVRTEDLKDNTDNGKDVSQQDYGESDETCIIETESYIVMDEDCSYEMEQNVNKCIETLEINVDEFNRVGGHAFNTKSDLNNSKKANATSENVANDASVIVTHGNVTGEHDREPAGDYEPALVRQLNVEAVIAREVTKEPVINRQLDLEPVTNRQLDLEPVIQVPEEMLIVPHDLVRDSTIQIIAEDIVVDSNAVNVNKTSFSNSEVMIGGNVFQPTALIGQVLIPNNSEFILCYNESEEESGDIEIGVDTEEMMVEDSLLFTSEDIESADATRVEDFCHEEEKIRQVFQSKSDVPRDAKSLTFNASENKLISELTKVGIKKTDLNKLQINMKPNKGKCEEKNNKTRHKYSDNRQAHLCPYCKYILKTRHSLKTHILAKHSDSNPFSCDVCDKKFPAKWNLKKHKEFSHEKVEMVECDVCNNLFKASYIKRHRDATHATKTETNCDICEKVFVSRQVMLQHKRKFHK